MDSRILLTERGPVHYWVSHVEGAPALVLLHGLTADHTLFAKQFEAFEGKFTLLAWDAPAHGASRPYDGFDYSLAAEHLRAILDIEGIAHATFIGQSMGGFIAQGFLANNPAYGDGFIAIDTCPLGESYYSASDRWWLGHVEALVRCYPLGILRAAMVRACARTPWARENMRTILAAYPKRELCHLMGIGFGGFLSYNSDVVVPCRTLLLLGELDRTGKVRGYNEAWHERTGYPLVVVKGAAHNANADQPEFVNAQIEAFVAECTETKR